MLRQCSSLLRVAYDLLPRTAQHQFIRNATTLPASPQAPRFLNPITPRTSVSLSQVAAALRGLPSLPDSILSLSASEAELFNETVPSLYSALSKGNLSSIRTLWNTLTHHRLVGYLAPAQHESISKGLGQLIREQSSTSDWYSNDQPVIEEIALATAVGGYVDALRSCMCYRLRNHDSQAVLELYKRYESMMEEKHEQLETSDQEAGVEAQSDTSPATLPRSPGDSAPALMRLNPEDGQLSISLPQALTLQPNGVPLIRTEILLCAIAAYAQKDAFLEAMTTTLKTRTRIPINSVVHFMRQHIDFDKGLSAKVQQYAKRIDTARLIHRPQSFVNQVSNITRDNQDKYLHQLYTSIISELRDPSPWLVVHAADVSASKPILFPDFAWSLMLSGFLRCHRLDYAEKLWDDMTNLGVKPSLLTWNALIEGYAFLRMTDRALAAWNMMRKQGIAPNALSHRALIHGFFQAGLHDQALVKFREYQKDKSLKDEFLNLLVYNTAIHGLLFHSRVQDANAILEEMKQHGPSPDIVTYNTFMRYYGREGKLPELASILQAVDQAGLKGDTFTFCTLLTSLLRVRKDAPKIMFDLMEKQGVKPNCAMHTAIIDHQVKQKTMENLRAAMDILTMMEQNESSEVHPNDVTYTTILTGVLRADWLDPSKIDEYREELTERMKRRKVTPNAVTYNILLNACLDNPERAGVKNALRYYREMVNSRVYIGNNTWFVLLRGLMARKEFELAVEVVEDMERSGFVPLDSLRNYVAKLKQRPEWSMRRQLTGAA